MNSTHSRIRLILDNNLLCRNGGLSLSRETQCYDLAMEAFLAIPRQWMTCQNWSDTTVETDIRYHAEPISERITWLLLGCHRHMLLEKEGSFRVPADSSLTIAGSLELYL
jgi:hypothetical protein